MQLLQQSEATGAQARLFFHAVDATDGIAAETGLTGTGRISKNGAATAATSASIVEIDSTNMPGRYYIQLTAGELDTVGIIEFRYKAAACAEVVARAQVVPFDPYDSVRAGLTALPNAAAGAAGGLPTDSTGKTSFNDLNAAGVRSAVGLAAANLDTQVGTIDTNVDTLLTRLVGTIAAGTHNPQSGDVFAQLPTNFSDLAITITTGRVTVGTNADKTGYSVDTVNDKTGYALSAAGVDAIWDEVITGHATVDTFGKVFDDQIDGLRAYGDAGWATAVGFSTHSAADVWAVGTRALTDKAGFSLSAAGIDAIWDELTAGHVTASTFAVAITDILTDTGTTLDAHLTDIKGTGFVKDTHSLTDILADVTGLAGAAMRGTDSALLASSAPTNWSSMGIEADGHVHGDLKEWLGVAPLALTGQRPNAYVGAMGGNVITSSIIATDAIGSAQLAATAAQKIRDEILPTQNAAFNNIQFLFVAASDHVTPVTGATGMAVTRSIDGAAFGSGTGTGPTEIGNGIYQYDASAADMNGGVITFRFTATGGTPGAPDDAFVTIVTGGGV